MLDLEGFSVKDNKSGQEFPLSESSIYGYKVQDLVILAEMLKEAQVTPEGVAMFVHDTKNAYLYAERMMRRTGLQILCDEAIQRQRA